MKKIEVNVLVDNKDKDKLMRKIRKSKAEVIEARSISEDDSELFSLSVNMDQKRFKKVVGSLARMGEVTACF